MKYEKGLGNRLRQVRIKEGLLQKEFADVMETKQQYISRYELGGFTPSLAFLIRLAKKFDVDLHWLLTGSRYSTRDGADVTENSDSCDQASGAAH